MPERVCQRAEQSGPLAQRWLKDLPERIHERERDWHVTIGPALSGGSAAFVATARTSEGVDAVVKLSPPDNEFKRVPLPAATPDKDLRDRRLAGLGQSGNP